MVNFFTKYYYLKKRRHFVKKEVLDTRENFVKRRFWLKRFKFYQLNTLKNSIDLTRFGFPIGPTPDKQVMYRVYSQRFSHSIFSLNLWCLLLN